MVAHAQLWTHVGTLLCPRSILRLFLQSYKWHRRIEVGDVVSESVFPGLFKSQS